jgi:hypothetical protein
MFVHFNGGQFRAHQIFVYLPKLAVPISDLDGLDGAPAELLCRL